MTARRDPRVARGIAEDLADANARDEDLMAELLVAAAAAESAVANCHEVRACPRCNAPVGKRCVNITRTYRRNRVLKHPHPERCRGLLR